MIICDFYIVRMAVNKPEADAPLIVHRYRILARPVAIEFMESISGRRIQIVQNRCKINVLQFTNGAPYNFCRYPSRPTVGEQFMCRFISE